MKGHAMILVHCAKKATDLGTQNFLHRHGLGSDDIGLDAAGAKRGSNLKADKTCANHDGAACRLHGFHKSVAVGEATQIMNVRKVGAGNLELHRPCAGGEQKRVICVAVTVRRFDLTMCNIDAYDRLA